MENEVVLLQRYAEEQDADSFAELVRRYAGMVYGTCLRVTQNSHDAEDVAQECFMELARRAGSIKSSLAGWLHSTARNRSINAIRNASTERRYKEQAMSETSNDTGPKWDEIAPHVDEALERLPEYLRESVTLHYFSGHTQEQIAAQLGVNQSTVSRRVEKGVWQLRGLLKKAGVVTSATALAAALTEKAFCAAPATLMAALGKIALAGVSAAATGGAVAAAGGATAAGSTGASASSAATTALLGTLKAKIAATIIAGAVVTGGVVGYRQATKPQPPAVSSETRLKTQSVDKQMKTEPQKGPYGFRYDPMGFIEHDESLQAAMVRKSVLRKPNDGDEETIQAEIDKVLKGQREDGSFGDTAKETGSVLVRLLELGYPADDPKVKRAAEVILRQTREGKSGGEELFELEGRLPIHSLRALCLARVTNPPEVSTTLQWLVDNPHEWAGKGCPWTPALVIKALSEGRDVVETGDAIDKGLRWIYENLNGAGCISYFDPWSFVDCAGYVDHALCKRIVEKQLPLILRAQKPDGGWGMPDYWPTMEGNLAVFRALAKYGLLDKLKELPALPPDWKVIRSIPAPDGELRQLEWDGEQLWTYEGRTNEAIAVSPEDGSMKKRVKLPEGNLRGMCWFNGSLAITQGDPWKGDPKRLVLVDPETGEMKLEVPLDDLEHVGGVGAVDNRLWLADSFFGYLSVLDPGQPRDRTKPKEHFPGPLATDISTEGDMVWHDDLWAHGLIKSDVEGKFLDWGEKPFDDATTGLAWDGKNLWALDNRQKRICVIEKAAPVSTIVQVRREGGKVWLEPIPRVPLRVQFFDNEGKLVGAEDEYPSANLTPRVLTCLYSALQMMGYDIYYEELCAATADAFCFTFEEGWGHEGEYITPIDALQSACAILGLEYTYLRNQPLKDSLQIVKTSIDNGRPALTGVDRSWRLIVGYNDQTKEYYYTPDRYEVYRAKEGEKLSPYITLDECHLMRIPESDWYSCELGPAQVVRNPVFVPGKRKPVSTRERIVKSLRLALEINQSIEFGQTNPGFRKKSESDFLRVRTTRFLTGNPGIRRWAEKIEALQNPDQCWDHDMIHANDTTLGNQFMRMVDAHRYLAWAANQVSGKAAEHLQLAAKAMKEAAEVDRDALRVWTCELHTEEDIRKAISETPSLIYIIDEEKQHLLGDLKSRARKGMWGLNVVPDKATFEIAKTTAVQNLNSVADLRDTALAEIEKALAAMAAKGKVRKDDDMVWIEGVPNLAGWGQGQENTFMGSLALTLQVMGEDVDYDYLMGVSGRAFRVQLCQPDWCASAPDAGCGFNCMETAKKAVGYAWEDVETDPEKVPPDNLDAILYSIEAGKPVVAMDLNGGMDWGVVAGHSDGGKTLLCRTYAEKREEYTPNRKWPWLAVVIGDKGGEPDRKANFVQSLKFAVELANTKKYDNYASGFAAYDAWIRDLSDDKRFEGDEEKVNGMVHPNAWCYYSLYDARAAAARYLRTIEGAFSSESGSHIAAAADIYEQIAGELREGQKYAPFPRQLNGGPWTKEMRLGQAEVLKSVLALERKAVAEIEKALAAMDAKGEVRKDDDMVWIEGVPTLAWGKGKETTFCGALEAALAVTEHPYSYEKLMGLSGLAFRTRWYEGSSGDRWCPSSPVGEFPEEYAAIEKATGWNLPTEVFLGEENPQMERFAWDIVQSIESGTPVLAYEPRLNMDVIYGYEDDGKILLMRDYFKGEETLLMAASDLGPLITFIRRRGNALPEKDALIDGLKIAVKNWRRESMPWSKGKYWYGDAAFKAWIRDLGQVDSLTDKERELLFFVSWWNFNCFVDARAVAVSFLREGAKITGGEAGKALERAAALYEKEVKLFYSVFAKKDAFLGPWSGKSIEDWTADVQRSERTVLEEARLIEETAILEIEKALAAEGISTSDDQEHEDAGE